MKITDAGVPLDNLVFLLMKLLNESLPASFSTLLT